jgi:hypothetical protein
VETQPENPPNGRAAGDGTKKLGQRIGKVGHSAEQVWDRTRDSVSDIGQALDIQGRVDRHPYGTVAAAIGIGYVLGGGLFTPLTARIVRMGLRMGMRLALLPMLKQEMAEIVNTIEEEEEAKSRGESGRTQAASKTNVNKGR